MVPFLALSAIATAAGYGWTLWTKPSIAAPLVMQSITGRYPSIGLLRLRRPPESTKPHTASASHRTTLNPQSPPAPSYILYPPSLPPPPTTTNQPIRPSIQSEHLHTDPLRALDTPITLWFFGIGMALFAVGMVYLELKYSVWSRVDFARDGAGGGGGRGRGLECSWCGNASSVEMRR